MIVEAENTKCGFGSIKPTAVGLNCRANQAIDIPNVNYGLMAMKELGKSDD